MIALLNLPMALSKRLSWNRLKGSPTCLIRDTSPGTLTNAAPVLSSPRREFRMRSVLNAFSCTLTRFPATPTSPHIVFSLDVHEIFNNSSFHLFRETSTTIGFENTKILLRICYNIEAYVINVQCLSSTNTMIVHHFKSLS